MLYFITISRKKNSTDRSFSFSIQRENKYACVRSEHFEQLDHEHKPTTVCLPSRKNESTTLPLLLPRTMASIVYLEIEAACNESSLEIVDAPSKSGCAGIKRRHCLPPSYPVRLERHLAQKRSKIDSRSLPVDFSLFREIPRIESSRLIRLQDNGGEGIIYHSMEWRGFLNSSNACKRFVRFPSML